MSIVYWMVFISVFLLGIMAEKHPQRITDSSGQYQLRPDRGAVNLLSAVLILVSGLRYSVGADYFSYYRWYITDWQQVWDKLIHFGEWGFAFVAMLSKTIYNHNQSLIFISSVITVGLFCWGIYRYHTMFLVSILLFIFLGLWQESFNAVRQCMASAIIFSGHRLILERKPWKFFLLVLVAASFHITAIIMVVPYFLLTRKVDMKQIAILAIGAIVLRFSYDVIYALIESYKGPSFLVSIEYYSRHVNIFRIGMAFVPVALYFLFCRKDHLTKEQNFYINALFFNAFAAFASMGSAYFARVWLYTSAMVIIGYGYLFQLIDDEKTKNVVIYVVMTSFFFYWLYSLMVAGSTLRDYNWVFNIGVRN